MAIPASVTLYANWVNGTLSAGTYTAATPDKPNGHTYTFSGSATIGVEAGSPWNGQTLASLPTWNSNVTSTLSSATMQATSGRVFTELNEQDPTFYRLMRFAAATAANGELWLVKQSGNLVVKARWNGDNSFADVSLGTYPTAPFAVELIYDLNNATANQRLRARTWSVGGSPGSFVNATATGGSAAASDQFTSFSAMPDGEVGGLKFGRVAVSNDINEDLSSLSEGGGTAIAAIVHHLRQQGVQ